MFTFGYKTSVSSILRALASIGIGLVMIFDNDASETVVKVIAAFLFASGLVSLVYGIIRNRKEGILPLMAVNAVVDVILGLNLKESIEIADVLHLEGRKDPEAAILENAQAIREKLNLACVVIHPRRGAAAGVPHVPDGRRGGTARGRPRRG